MIELKDVSLKLGDKQIYNKCNLDLTEGFYGLVGKNGNGKTSLFNILYNEVSYTGTIKFNGIDIKNLSKGEIRNNLISYINQDSILFENLTIRENINVINKKYYNNIIKSLEEFKMLHLLDKKIKNISGGEEQKVNILIGIYTDSPIVLIDEPFNNIDKNSIKIIENMIENLKNKYVILIAHNYDYPESFKILEIIDNKILKNSKVVDNKILKNSKAINNELINKKQVLTKKKILKKYYINFFMIFLIFLGFNFIIFNFINLIQYNKVESLRNSDTILIKDSQENIEGLEEIYPVNNVEAGEALYNANEEKIADINIKNLDYNIYYNSDLVEKNQEILYEFGENVEVYKIPLYNSYKFLTDYIGELEVYQIDSLILGDFPKDNSNEIIIDENLALYLATENDLDNIEQLINKEYKNFKISGVYKSADPGISYIYSSYNNMENDFSSATYHTYYGERESVNIEEIEKGEIIVHDDIKILKFIEMNINKIIVVSIIIILYLTLNISLILLDLKLKYKDILVYNFYGDFSIKNRIILINILIWIIALFISILFLI